MPPGTSATLQPFLAGFMAINGTQSAKRCVKLAQRSAAESRGYGLSALETLAELPPAYRPIAHRCSH
jgi:hypothetical protein